MQEKKAQAAMEYIAITAVVLIIIVAIFGVSIATTNQSVKGQQISQSLESLVQTADLVYAMGKGNVLYTTIVWPQEVESMAVIYKCKTDSGEDDSILGCSGGITLPGDECECTVTPGGCAASIDCIQYSALRLTSKVFADTPLEYVSKAKINNSLGGDCGNGDLGEFCIKNFRYNVKVSWEDSGYIKLERQ